MRTDRTVRRRRSEATHWRRTNLLRSLFIGGSLATLALGVAREACAQNVAPAFMDSRILSSDTLSRDANGQPRFDALPFVFPAAEPPAEVKARIQALSKAADSATRTDQPAALPALPPLPPDPLAPPRMDAGDPNPDGINTSKIPALERRWGR